MPKRVSPARFRIHPIPETDMHDPERDIRDIPLSQLELSSDNVRKTPADASAFTELKASIAAHGLLENLIARAMGPGPDGIGRYAVIAGGRRLAAMQALAAEGALEEDHPVPCRMIGAIVAAEEVSLAENSVRAAMHPADQVEAFRRLADAGSTAAAIAARFRGLGAHRGEAAKARQRRTSAARGLPRRRNRSGNVDGLRRHHRSGAPERGLGGGKPTGLPARRLADQAPADRGPGSGHLRNRAFRRHRGLRGGGRQDRPRPVRRGGRAGDLVRRSRSLEQSRHGQPPGRGDGTEDALEMGRGTARHGLERHRRLRAGAPTTGRADGRREGRDPTLEGPATANSPTWTTTAGPKNWSRKPRATRPGSTRSRPRSTPARSTGARTSLSPGASPPSATTASSS